MLSSNDSYYLPVLAKAAIFFYPQSLWSLLSSPLWSAFLPQLQELAAPSLNVTCSLSKRKMKHWSSMLTEQGT